MIEVEKKYEVSRQQFDNIYTKIARRGDYLGTEVLTDLIFNITKVAKGYNFDRIRLKSMPGSNLKNIPENSPELERKEWNGDNRIERPIEYVEVSKSRITYDLGSYKVMLDHFKERCFIEIEMLTDNPEEVPNLEDKIVKIAKELIDGELIKAPSYLSMALDNRKLVEDILGDQTLIITVC